MIYNIYTCMCILYFNI